MHCRVTLTNSGSRAPTERVGFRDVAKTLLGPPAAAAVPLITAAKTDDEAWKCSGLPANNLKCSIEGPVLEPGHRHSVDIVMDLSALIANGDWRLRNCATLNGTDTKKCIWRGDGGTLIVTKSGPDQVPCMTGPAGGPCDFQLTVANPGAHTFDGPLFFGDNMTIGGAAIGGINVDGVVPTHGCIIANPTLPLEWQCHVTIPPGGQKTFKMLLTIPPGAVLPGVAQGRNCFIATDPGLVLVNNAPPANFWTDVLDPAKAGNRPGVSCVDFAVQPAAPNQIVPQRIIPALPDPGFWGPPIGPGTVASMTMTVTANPAFFSNPGDVITFTYEVANTGNVPIQTFKITDNLVSPGLPVGNCDRISIAVGAKATCSANYTTVAADMNSNIVTTATVTGTY